MAKKEQLYLVTYRMRYEMDGELKSMIGSKDEIDKFFRSFKLVVKDRTFEIEEIENWE